MGRNTREALKAFQHEHHLKEDGVAGPRTLKAIDAALKERGVPTHAAPANAPITGQTPSPIRLASPQITDPAHPGNGLFKQAQNGMQAIDAGFGRTSDHQTDNAAGVVALKAHGAGMTRIDVMDLNDKGEKIIAAQGQPGSAHSKVIDVPTVMALNTPLEQSSQAFVDAHHSRLAASQSNSQQTTPHLTQQQAAPVLS